MSHTRVLCLCSYLVGAAAFAALDRVGADEVTDADLALLKHEHVGSDGASLLSFFRKLSPTDAEQQQLKKLIHQLGNGSFSIREKASIKLVETGPPSLPFLRAALADDDAEIVRRARFCIEEIEGGPGPALPAAAARVLVLRQPPGTVEALLTYLPFVEDEFVEDEILSALCHLGVRHKRVDQALKNALQDASPARRGAAAFVLGKLDDGPLRAAVRKLLADADARVRFRSAESLAVAGEQEAVPVLIALLEEAPLALSWRAQEILYRIASQDAPTASIIASDVQSRTRCRSAWAAWWRDHRAKVDLAKLSQAEQQLGLTVIVELDSNKVWECGRDGKPRWKLDNLQGPADAQVLPGGRVLIAENYGMRVTERDLTGKILWERSVPQRPIACQRLPNGNTFIATFQGLTEINRDGKETFSYNQGGNWWIWGAHRLRNGHMVCITGQGMVVELDAGGKEVKSIAVANNGGWCAVEGLPGGRYLVALTNQNKVIEVDSSGKTVWQCEVAGAGYATRLPNGNTLVTCMNNRCVLEVDRAGKKVWEQATDGRPWRAHRR